MEIIKETIEDVLVIALKGRLDANTAGDLEKALIPTIDKGIHNIVLDLEELDYISSAGLRIFLMALKKMQNVKGKLVLCSLKEMIQEVFKIAGFLPIFQITGSRFKALEEFK